MTGLPPHGLGAREVRIKAWLAKTRLVPLAERIAYTHRTSVDAMVSRSRLGTPVAARHELWSVVSGTLGLSATEIGNAFAVDHTTILSAIDKRERVMRAWLTPSLTFEPEAACPS